LDDTGAGIDTVLLLLQTVVRKRKYRHSDPIHPPTLSSHCLGVILGVAVAFVVVVFVIFGLVVPPLEELDDEQQDPCLEASHVRNHDGFLSWKTMNERAKP
jgi:hypothetical protein